MTERKETLGYVGVDSGQLMIIDPCYMLNKNMGEGEIIGLKFWGRDAEELAHFLKGCSMYEVNGEYPFVIKANEETIESIKNEIKDIIRKNNWLVVMNSLTDSMYDSICNITASENQGGEVDLGLAFTSGLGDGYYEVIATYKDLESWGERITKVEITLVDKDGME